MLVAAARLLQMKIHQLRDRRTRAWAARDALATVPLRSGTKWPLGGARRRRASSGRGTPQTPFYQVCTDRTAGILKGLTLAMTRAEKSLVAPSHICVLTQTALLLAAISLAHIHIHIL